MQTLMITKKTIFRNKLMYRKRGLRLTPIPKIRVRVYTDRKGFVHCLFGFYGKQANPTQYNDKGEYIDGQPFYAWISATLNRPDYKPRWNSDLKRQFWNYLRYNIKNLHPCDLTNHKAPSALPQ